MATKEEIADNLEAYLTVTRGITYFGYTGIIDRPGGCLEGVIMPESVSEADSEYADRAAAGGGAPEDAEDERPVDDPKKKNDDTQEDNDKDAEKKKKSEACYEGAPSHNYEKCIKRIAKDCNCNKCVCWVSGEAPPEDEEPSEEDEEGGEFGSPEEEDGEYLDESEEDVDRDLTERGADTEELTFKSDWYDPIPIVYGRYPVEATIIDIAYDADADTLTLVAGVAQGKIGYVSRIWFGQRLIYDQTFSTTNTNIADIEVDFYMGGEAQKVVSQLATHRAFGRQPAYRNLAHVTFKDIAPDDLYAITGTSTINALRVEVVEFADSNASLTYDDGHQYSPDFLKVDDVNNAIYGTTFGVEEWPEQLSVGGDETTFINVMSWDTGFYRTSLPYAVTDAGDILQKYLGYNHHDNSYLQFYHPIDFAHDKHRTRSFDTPLYHIVVAYNSADHKLYAHHVSKMFKCAYAARLAVPSELSSHIFVGTEYFEEITSVHLSGNEIVFHEQSGEEAARTTTISLPAPATRVSQIQRIRNSNKFVILFENSNMMCLFSYAGALGTEDNDAAFSLESYFTFDATGPHDIWSRYIGGREFYYLSRDNDIIHVDIVTGVFTNNGPVGTTGMTDYWYQPSIKRVKFVTDNRLWTYDVGLLTPRKVTLGHIYRNLSQRLWDDIHLSSDLTALDAVEVDGFLQDADFKNVLVDLNNLFGVEIMKSEELEFYIPDTSTAMALDTEYASERRQQLREQVSEVSLSYSDYSDNITIQSAKVTVSAVHRQPDPSVKLNKISFRFKLIAQDYDFRPLLELHLVTLDGDEITLEANAQTSLVEVGDVLQQGRVIRITDNSNFQRTIMCEPTRARVSAEQMPDPHDPLEYLQDNINRDLLRPNILFIPALSDADAVDAGTKQIAYSLLEAPTSSDNNELGRRFDNEIPVKAVVRSDLEYDVVERIWNDDYTRGTYNGRNYADIQSTAQQIFTAKKFYVTSQGHSFAAHSGITRTPPPNIRLNHQHRTFHEEDEMVIEFHHKNTITYLKDMSRLDLLGSFTENLLIVGYELIQYETHTVHADGRTVTFGGLHRSQHNSGMYSDNHVGGERAYLYTADTIKPFAISRWATLRQPYVEMRAKDSNNIYRTVADAGSARPLAPTDLQWEYSPGDQHLVLSCKFSSETFRRLFEDQFAYLTKDAGVTQLYVVAHILNGDYNRHDFEEELINGRYNDNFSSPLIRATFSGPVTSMNISGEITMRILSSELHKSGIYPESSRLPIVMHFGLMVEAYHRPSAFPGHMWKSGIVGYPAYMVMPAVPDPYSNVRTGQAGAAVVLSPAKNKIMSGSAFAVLTQN